jgi:broad specificity phosphatase PhoE
MYKSIFFVIVLILLSCNTTTTTYYIVRHAEKETSTAVAYATTSDVPLSKAGERRAEALRDSLMNEGITHIFSTNYMRTRSTAHPLSDADHVPIETYDPKDPNFLAKLKSLEGKVLIVGHSNTVDDLVNELAGVKEISGDLPDTQYGDLFIITKKGNKISCEKKHFGQ